MSSKKLIEDVAAATGETRAKVKAILEATGAALADGIKSGGDITLPGIGKLRTKHRASRVGRNPKTGEEVQIPARVAVKFTASKALKEAVA